MTPSSKTSRREVAPESKNRPPEYLAVDVSADLSVRNWRRQMDLTRALYGHDESTPQGEPRTFYLFTLSPIGETTCSLNDFRSFAREWAEECFRSGARVHEYAILYRFEGEAFQACVVVNVTNKRTRRKFRVWGMDNIEFLAAAREIGKSYGLGRIDLEIRHSHESLREGDL